MRATVYHGPRDVRVEDVPDAALREPTDALVRVTHACICGSDLWPYRGELEIYGRPGRTGHEFMGVVEEVGADVRTIRPGQRVIAPFAYSDGTCDFCAKGLMTSCRTGGYWGGRGDGGQGEAVRAPLADGTLVPLPDEVDLSDDRLAAALATLTDVMGTGHHGAVNAGVAPGATVAVIGDGAVGLCAVLASRRLGAERIIVVGHHDDRLAIARRFGATDVVAERGEEAVDRVRELTDGGAEHVVEAVGAASSFATAIDVARPGGTVGHVGVPVHPVNLGRVHLQNIRLLGGVAPVRGYMENLMADILAGKLDPSPVLDTVLPLEEVPEGYAAMDERRALKVLVRTGAA
ncbi:MAG TPA: alcohol dehydrogenase catalytic domain-containing protein [Miltoncostaeaceae bacterium]|jgi:threonine dehydrogenase-like Zn-dependent dehydrogenase|nr:alcohol dehydrogenase catalytic domain-containing protein [Miltoncostaeaceae bacterium]